MNFRQLITNDVPFSFKMEVWERSMLFQITSLDTEIIVPTIELFMQRNNSKSCTIGSKNWKTKNGIIIQMNVGNQKPVLSRNSKNGILEKITLPLHCNGKDSYKSVDLTEFHSIDVANASFNQAKIALNELNENIIKYYVESVDEDTDSFK